jgi:hypothetical protein
LTVFPFWRSARRTRPVKSVALLPSESNAVTTTGGVTTPPRLTVSGSALKVSCAAGPGATVNVSLVTVGSPAAVAVSV